MRSCPICSERSSCATLATLIALLNELELVKGELWAKVVMTKLIARIDTRVVCIRS